jgi:hypothetical protein
VTQQRLFPRFAADGSVTITVAGKRLMGRTANLSRGGLCAMLAEPITVGAPVALEAALAFDNDSFSEPLAFVGRVVWCTAVGARFQVGVAFVSVTPEAVTYLDVFLRYLEEGKRKQRAASRTDPFDD